MSAIAAVNFTAVESVMNTLASLATLGIQQRKCRVRYLVPSNTLKADQRDALALAVLRAGAKCHVKHHDTVRHAALSGESVTWSARKTPVVRSHTVFVVEL